MSTIVPRFCKRQFVRCTSMYQLYWCILTMLKRPWIQAFLTFGVLIDIKKKNEKLYAKEASSMALTLSVGVYINPCTNHNIANSIKEVRSFLDYISQANLKLFPLTTESTATIKSITIIIFTYKAIILKYKVVANLISLISPHLHIFWLLETLKVNLNRHRENMQIQQKDPIYLPFAMRQQFYPVSLHATT